MKEFYLFLIFVTQLQPVLFGQLPPAECKCGIIPFIQDTTTTSFYRSDRAQELVDKYLALAKNSLPIEERANIKEIFAVNAPCVKSQIAMAVNCNNVARVKNGNYILFDGQKFDDLAEIEHVDAFVLAHEVGHHIYNHLHDMTDYLELKEYNHDIKCRGEECNTIRANHIKELEADYFAVWILSKEGVGQKEIEAVFDRFLYKASVSHPSTFVRVENVKKSYDFLKKNKNLNVVRRGKGFINESYDEILYSVNEKQKAELTELENRMIKLHSFKVESILLREDAVKSIEKGQYGLAKEKLQTSYTALKSSLYYPENDSIAIVALIEECDQIISKNNFFVLSPILKTSMIDYKLSVLEEPLLTPKRAGFGIGLRGGVYNWRKKTWIESEILYTQYTGGTLTKQAPDLKLVEEFNFRKVQWGLKYNFCTIARREPITSWGTGFFLAAGPLFNMYLPVRYKNYVNSSYDKVITVKPSLGGQVELGIWGSSRKRNKFLKNYTLSFSYDIHNISFNDDSELRGAYRFYVNIFSINLSYWQW